MFQTTHRKNYKELFLVIYIYLFLIASLITSVTSYIDGLYIDSYITFLSFLANLAILFYFKKSNNFKISALLWLWNATWIIFFGILYNEFSLEILYLPLVPLGASLLLSGRTLLIHGIIFLLLISLIFIYGFFQYPENPFLHDIKLFGNFVVLFLLILTFGIIYQHYIEKSYNELEKSHEENGILLQEVHHRVKNNLNMMSSILGLQDNGDKVISQLIESNRRRLESIALVHEFLYNNSTFKEISFKDYSQKLSQHLVQAIAPFPVKINIDTERTSFSLNTMATIGLILQELITNSLKHGLKHAGEIFISLHRNKNIYVLKYRDSGTKDHTKPSSQSLGLSLIDLKVKELSGTLQMDTDKYYFEIRFPHE